MNDHLHFLQLIAGRELGGLDAAESAELDEHLVGCQVCRAESRLIGDAAAQIAFAAPVRQPPASMRSAILAAIHEAAADPVTTPTPVSQSTGKPASPTSDERARRATSGWLAWLRGSHLRLATTGLTAILMVVSLGIGVRTLNLQSQLDAQARAIAAAQQHQAVEGAAMAVVLDPSHLSARLDPQAAAPAAIAEVVYRPGTDEGYLIAAHLPATQAGYVYQLWYADASGVHPLGTFAFDGSGTFIAPFGMDLGGKSAAMVTLEEGGGSTGQPGPQVVFGKLPNG
jgi:hypothetical protein